MAYPLGGSSSSVDMNFDPIVADIIYAEAFTYTWVNPFLNPISRSVDMNFDFNPALFIYLADGDHVWGGIGGSNYIPSFPQLDRQSTIYPHAF